MGVGLLDHASRIYQRLLLREIDGVPTHVAIIQDGNRRYARRNDTTESAGHEAGAETTEQVLQWCADIGIEELTLYAFSTENFNRPQREREHIFDLLETKLYEFADASRIHEEEVCIRAIGEISQLPEYVQHAVRYAERKTQQYDRFRLNIALAYGGRTQLLHAAKEVTDAVMSGELAVEDIDVGEIEDRLYEQPVRDVDLILRTGGDERTSNFLPWHANGNEAAVVFCPPYWPEFSKIDFLRAIRTYESREASWRQTKAQRAVALVRAVAGVELDEAKVVARRLRDHLAGNEQEVSVVLNQETEPAD